MTLSDALIYLGICFMVLGIMMIAAARKSKKKACGNKKLLERIDFFKKKWQSEHIGLLLTPIGIILGLIVLCLVTKLSAFMYLAGAVLILLYVYIYNKMMAYIEENAFDGTGPDLDENDTNLDGEN